MNDNERQPRYDQGKSPVKNAPPQPIIPNSQATALIFDGVGQPLRHAQLPLPQQLDPGHLLVAIRRATLCGSDLHTLAGRRSAPTPCVLGHEAVGQVVAAGPDRTDAAAGDLITWTLADSCGACVYCTDYGLPEKCRALFKYGHAGLDQGHGLNGCYASHILLRPGTHTVPLDTTLDPSIAAPANCALATMVNALSHLPDQTHTVVLQGAGLLGIYGCALLHQRGVERVFCIDIEPTRLEQVASFGGIPVDGRSERETAAIGREIDAVVEVAGVPDLVPTGLDLLRPGGLYLFVGMVHPATQLDLTGEQVIRKCLTIRGIHNYSPPHLDQAVDFLQQTASCYPYASLVSPPLPLDHIDEAFDLARTRSYHRVAVTPEESP